MIRQRNFKLIIFYFIKSISFYPAVVSVLFIGLAILMLHFENAGLSRIMRNRLDVIIITHNDTARATLGSIITGMISITVFSFTMVMLVLNQTGTNYSPRLIPGLITHRSNQIVLGFFLGTLIYSLIILINVESEYLNYNAPGVSILLDILFVITSLGLFVYFIHSISRSIQIGNIMESVFTDTMKGIKKHLKEKDINPSSVKHDTNNWFSLESLESGFLQDFDENFICSIAEKYEIVLKFLIPPGFYVHKGIPFILVNKNDGSVDDQVCQEIIRGFTFKKEEIIGINFIFGFKHLSETAVKAMSPAINDPGTANHALNYLNELFIERMFIPDIKVIFDKHNVARIFMHRQTLSEMFSAYLSPIRNYSKGDLTVTKRMIEIVFNMAFINKTQKLGYDTEIYLFAKSVIEDADKNIKNSLDRDILSKRVDHINSEMLFKNKLQVLD